MAEGIAERVLVCVKPNGERIVVTLRIGKPYRASDVDWACPIAADGLYSELRDMHGIDSFQALMLAQKLFLQLMNSVIDDGGSFRNANDDSLVDIRQMFASGI